MNDYSIYVLVPAKVRIKDGVVVSVACPSAEHAQEVLNEYSHDCVSGHTWAGAIELLDELVEGLG